MTQEKAARGVPGADTEQLCGALSALEMVFTIESVMWRGSLVD